MTAVARLRALLEKATPGPWTVLAVLLLIGCYGGSSVGHVSVVSKRHIPAHTETVVSVDFDGNLTTDTIYHPDEWRLRLSDGNRVRVREDIYLMIRRGDEFNVIYRKSLDGDLCCPRLVLPVEAPR